MTEIYTTVKVRGKAGLCDQEFHVCKHCGHGQLAHVIDTHLQYGDATSYSFRTSESATGRRSADFVVRFIKKHIGKKQFQTIIELGCNDMYILKALQNRAKKLIGIDPVLAGKESEYTTKKMVAIGDFFEHVELDKGVDVVICKDTLEHVEDPKSFTKKIVDTGNADTLFFFHFPLLETLVTDCRFDQIFHQHLNYFSLSSIIYMLDSLGCRLLDYTIDHRHWGSISIVFKKGKNTVKLRKQAKKLSHSYIRNRYRLFKDTISNTSKRLSLLTNEKLYGYGAALMLPVLSYHLNNDFSSFGAIIDDDPNKDGAYYINLPVPIRSSKKITDITKAVVLVTAISAINNTRSILAKLKQLNPKKIIVALNTF